MPLIYSFVSRGTTVLADYTAYTGNFSVVAIQVSTRKVWVATIARTASIKGTELTSLLVILILFVQALEKGAQGNNAKFTYSCDGHSKFLYLSHA